MMRSSSQRPPSRSPQASAGLTRIDSRFYRRTRPIDLHQTVYSFDVHHAPTWCSYMALAVKNLPFW